MFSYAETKVYKFPMHFTLSVYFVIRKHNTKSTNLRSSCIINFLLISASLFQLNCTTSEPIYPSDVIFMDLATFPLYSRHSFGILYFSPANA